MERPSQTVLDGESRLELGAGLPLAAEAAGELSGIQTEGPWRRAARRFIRNRAALASLIVLAILALMAAFAPFMYTQDPLNPNFASINVGPNTSHWFGTDGLGRDLYSRLLYGLRVPFIIGMIGSTISMIIGSLLGVIAGFYGGKVDSLLARITDLVFAFPTFILALIVVSLFGPALDPYFGGAGRVIMLTGIFALVSWPVLMRVVRALALRIVQEPYIEAARVGSGKNWTIIRQHLLPNVFGLVLVQGSFVAVGLISTEAVLSIFGLGVEAPNPDLGAILYDGVQHMSFNGWEVFFPAAILTLLVLGFTFVGDGLRDALDTRGG